MGMVVGRRNSDTQRLVVQAFGAIPLFACTPATKYFCTLCSAVFCTNQSGFKETAFLFALLGACVRFAAEAALSAVAFRFRSASLIHAGVKLAGSCFDVCFGEVSSLKFLTPQTFISAFRRCSMREETEFESRIAEQDLCAHSLTSIILIRQAGIGEGTR